MRRRPDPSDPGDEVLLRDVTQDDLPVLFKQQRDPVANEMAAFPARDEQAFLEQWRKILGDRGVVTKAILAGGSLAGYVGSFEQSGRQLVAYWIGREYWGKGIATRALSLLLGHVAARPLYAYVAKHNIGSLRVLEKCGFVACDEAHGPPVPGYEGVEEVVMKLAAADPDPER
jgi:RimJ/RimL family protein N-acetyltransferase